LDDLRSLLKREGRLTGPLINRADDMFDKKLYQKRFDTLVSAYKLAGYNPGKDFRYTAINRQLHKLESEMVADIIERIQQLGGTVVLDPVTEIMEINSEFTATVAVARFRHWVKPRAVHWSIPTNRLKADVAIVVRMDFENREPRDFYLLPRGYATTKDLVLREHNGAHIDAHRFSNLDSFFGMIRRVKAAEAT
jgi:hypothetical protein